jgi:hypothetical protein
MPNDFYWAIFGSVGWIFGVIMAAYALGQARQLYDIRQRFAPFDRDHDGRPGGSLKRT